MSELSRTSLVYREECPSCPGIDAIWTLDVRHDLIGSPPYLALPDGCVDLIYRLKRDKFGKIDSAALLVAGPTDRPATFFPTAGEEFVGIRLAPGWGGLGLDVSPSELFRTFTDAGKLTSRLARLQDCLFACSSRQQTVTVLRSTVEAWVHEHTPNLRILEAVRMLRICGGQIHVEQAALLSGVSTRSFRRELKELVGLPPKSLLRIFRFRRALETINENNELSLSELAFETGYADQAHMTREFQRLGGFTPNSRAELPGNSMSTGGT